MSAAKKTGVIAAAVVIAAGIAQEFEGYRGAVYLDPAHILTQCYGETQDIDPSVIYSEEQCAAKLRARMAKDYAPALLACVPQFNDPRYARAFGALLDASYNAGTAAACRSPMAQHFRLGDIQRGCNAFPGWYVTAKNRKTGERVKLRGLVRRREYERDVCKGVRL